MHKVHVMGADATFVICNREQVTIAVGADALTEQVLDIELADGESAEALQPFLEELQAIFEVEVLLSDDQVCWLLNSSGAHPPSELTNRCRLLNLLEQIILDQVFTPYGM